MVELGVGEVFVEEAQELRCPLLSGSSSHFLPLWGEVLGGQGGVFEDDIEGGVSGASFNGVTKHGELAEAVGVGESGQSGFLKDFFIGAVRDGSVGDIKYFAEISGVECVESLSSYLCEPKGFSGI